MEIKTLADCYKDFYNTTYNALEANEKKMIDKYSKGETVSISNNLFGLNFIKTVIEKAERYFDRQKIDPNLPQISELKDNELVC